MEDSEINLLETSKNIEEVSQVLERFINIHLNSFAFTNLSENNRRVLIWTALFQRCQDQSCIPIHPLCLTAIRVLSRDKQDLESLICEKWIITLIEKAGLYNFVGVEEDSMISLEMPPRDIAVEALKCLCNIAFNSEVARSLCAHTNIAYGLVARLRVYKDIPFKDDIMLYDMKLLFILTVLRQDIKAKIKDELHGMDYLISCLSEILLEATNFDKMDVAGSQEVVNDHNCFLNDSQQGIVCEILKTQFNLIIRPGVEERVTEADEAIFLKLVPVITGVLYAQCSTQQKLMEVRSNAANLLTSVPPSFYSYLTPPLNVDETAQYMFEDRNMDALQALVELLQYRLDLTTDTKQQYENLSPILTVMNKGSRGCRAHRKYLRSVVLPPLRDVTRPPEQGHSLRNQLCRLLTSPVSSVRDLVAEFLFVLCKEKVGRLVKYTGFGNAAGHLAQKGLLRGGAGAHYSSSEDSDTEEYLEAQPRIDPVVGCTRPQRQNPFEGMTEEQKEYEAMKLVELFDKMVTMGVVQPAHVDADGVPAPLQHVLQLRDQLHRP